MSLMSKGITERSIVVQAYIWLALPVVQFLCFWFKPWIGVSAALLLIAALWRILRPGADLHTEGYSNVGNPKRNLLILFAILVYVAFCGIGAILPQIPFDHMWRNAVFFDLARNPWPVVYHDTAGEPVLCYYFAFWLPAAVVSKISGVIMLGDLFQTLYAAWGTWIALNFIFSRCDGRPLRRVFAIFVLFNAWDWVTALLLGNLDVSDLDGIWDCYLTAFGIWCHDMSAAANSSLYNYSYNQAIPLWVMLTLFLHERPNTGRLLLILSLLPVFSPFATIVFIPYVAFRILRDMREGVSAANIVGFFVALLSAAFLLQNDSAGSPKSLSSASELFGQWGKALIFYSISFLPFIPFFFRQVKRDLLYWSAIAIPVLLSPFGIGIGCDLAWRSSMPAVMMTIIMMCRRSAEFKKMRKWVQSLFVAVLAVGSFSSVYNIVYVVRAEILLQQGIGERKLMAMTTYLHKPENEYHNNFTASSDSFYRRWLAPRDAGLAGKEAMKQTENDED